jgi:hypothetical protein
MTAAQSNAQTPPAGDGIESPQQAATLIEQFGRIMDSLVETVEHETALVREGRLSEAGELEAVKAELAREYQAGTTWFKRNTNYLTRNLPALLKALHKRHDEFRAVLQINLTVLATAQAVSESIIRGVSGEMARKQSPQTYGASGKANTPGPRASQPISVSRSL